VLEWRTFGPHEDLAITVRDPGNNEWSELVLDRAVASTDRLWRFLRPGQV
jgi:hypothetical protein